MGLVTRGNSTLYYRSSRRGGRVVCEYVASGGRALAAAAEAEDARETRAAVKARIIEDLDHERTIADYSRDVDRRIADALRAAGYHRHDRGAWRKARKFSAARAVG